MADIAASVLAKLKNKAKDAGISYQQCLQLFMQEEFLSAKIVGQAIAFFRKKKGISQEVLSGFAGIARTHLTMIENGTKQANFETIWRIALALDLRPSQLVEQIERECLAPGSTEADAKK